MSGDYPYELGDDERPSKVVHYKDEPIAVLVDDFEVAVVDDRVGEVHTATVRNGIPQDERRESHGPTEVVETRYDFRHEELR